MKCPDNKQVFFREKNQQGLPVRKVNDPSSAQFDPASPPDKSHRVALLFAGVLFKNKRHVSSKI